MTVSDTASDRAARTLRPSFGANLDRLLAAKRRYDPDNVFASTIPTLID